MKRNILLSIVIIFGLAGCGSSPVKLTPSIKTTEKFRINSISLKLVQTVTPEIVYHTEKEISDIVIAKIKDKLNKENLLSDNKAMTSLDIKMTYYRTFVGDGTPFPSDSLRYPEYAFEIVVKDGISGKLLATINRDNLAYSGNFFDHLQVAAMTFRDKSYEIPFMEVFANTIVEYIKDMKQ